MNFIESYFVNNFMGSTSDYTAGMNFSNLVLAVPIIATLLLMLFNVLRSVAYKYIPPKMFSCKFQLPTIVSYVCIIFILQSLHTKVYLSSSIVWYFLVIGYLFFMLLAFCFYEMSDCKSIDNDDIKVASIKEYLCTIQNKVQILAQGEIKGNILINGSWGSGKSYFVREYLNTKLTNSVYLSCTDYADIHELVTELTKKTNNCFMRLLMLFSISRLVALIGKTELKQYIGMGQIIIFDEFERLVDYNKIDPMHIVSLIQYLNQTKKCVCILVANDNHLQEMEQFINVREKLITSVYHYHLPFNEALKIVQSNNNEIKFVLDKDKFGAIYSALEKWYKKDYNIRMIQHLYIKIAQLYSSYLINIQDDNFLKDYINKDETKRDELFADLFGYVETVVIQLYYLYLKNPYYLTAISKLAFIYINLEDGKYLSLNNDKYFRYVDKLGVQKIAYKFSLDKNEIVSDALQYILKNDIFAEIDGNLLITYLCDFKFIAQFLSKNECSIANHNIQIFMKEFREIICESNNPDLVIKYFKSVNIFEERFKSYYSSTNSSLRRGINVIGDAEKRIILEYIEFAQYIDNNQSTLAYDAEYYINALVLYIILIGKNRCICMSILENKLLEIYKYRTNETLSLHHCTYLIIDNEGKILDLVGLLDKMIKYLLLNNENINPMAIFILLSNAYRYMLDMKLKNEKITEKINNIMLEIIQDKFLFDDEILIGLCKFLEQLNSGYRLNQGIEDRLFHKVKQAYSRVPDKEDFIAKYKETSICQYILPGMAKRLQQEMDQNESSEKGN